MLNWMNGANRLVPAVAAAGVGQAAPEQKQPHNWQFAGNASGRRPAGGRRGAPSHEPQKTGITRRALLALVLLVLLPPLGIALMWHKGIFELRGRILLTVIGAVIMTVMFSFLLPQEQALPVAPQPVKAQLRSPLPTDATLNALSNMEELLAGVENKPVENTDLNEATGQTVEEDLAEPTQEPVDPMAEIVYAVNSGAKYYHKSGECKGQVNRRTLLVSQALEEGLKPCGRCDPPSP